MGLGVVRSLGERGVRSVAVQFDKRDIAQRSRYVREVHRVPRPDVHEDDFVAALASIGARHPGALLVPAHDAAVVAIARHRRQLEQTMVVACPGWDVAQLYIDKRETYRVAASAGVPTPKTLTPRSSEEAERALDEIGAPALVKPSQSHLFVSAFGRKMLEATSAAEVRAAYELAEGAGLEVMVQEIIPGPDSAGVNYNAYTVAGQPVAEFTARKVRNSPSRWGSPRVAVSERVDEVVEPGRRLLAAVGYEGFSCTEWKQDERDGVFKLMEVNGRHNLSSMLAVRCGIDFPWIEYRHRVHGVLPDPIDRFEEGRYWIDLVRDLGTSWTERNTEAYGVADYLRPYRGPRAYAHWSARDPVPMAARLWDAARRGRRAG
jgi:predicted ATP-grasp superfamily ATP-dependent carboligase